MSYVLGLMQEFWQEFYEDRVDLKKIRVLSDKLFPVRTRIKQIFEEKLPNEKYSTFNILKLYAAYQRMILNQE